MLFAGFSIIKLLAGFNLFNGEKLGKLIYQVIIILLVLVLVVGIWYKMFGQRTNTTKQEAQTITNITQLPQEDTFFMGIKIGSLKLGLRL